MAHWLRWQILEQKDPRSRPGHVILVIWKYLDFTFMHIIFQLKKFYLTLFHFQAISSS